MQAMRLRGGGAATEQSDGKGLKVAVWNAERFDAKGMCGGSACSAECRDKRRWIEEYIDGAEPDVVGILEVIASLKQLRVIRKWLRPRGYEVALLAGEGGSRSSQGTGCVH